MSSLAFDGFTLVVRRLPGHSIGHVARLDEDGALRGTEGHVLIGGDLLLQDVTPNPIPEAGPGGELARALAQFLDSLGYLEALPIGLVLPGHGPAIHDHRRLIAQYRAHHARRLDQVGMLVDPKGTTCFEIARRLYPQSYHEHVFQAVAESYAHLLYLVDQGRIRAERRGGVEYYIPVG